eukprot:9891011-Alexandrium_andersonii.AAC.1
MCEVLSTRVSRPVERNRVGRSLTQGRCEGRSDKCATLMDASTSMRHPVGACEPSVKHISSMPWHVKNIYS